MDFDFEASVQPHPLINSNGNLNFGDGPGGQPMFIGNGPNTQHMSTDLTNQFENMTVGGNIPSNQPNPMFAAMNHFMNMDPQTFYNVH